MKTKRILSMLMAGLMAANMSVTAFANGITDAAGESDSAVASVAEEASEIPLEITWHDTEAVSEERPAEVTITMSSSDGSYTYTDTTSAGDSWEMNIPYNEFFLDEEYVKDELEVTVAAENGQDVPYSTNIYYSNGIMYMNMRYNMPFEIQWDTEDHPSEVYVQLRGEGYRSGFTYRSPRTAPFHDSYAEGTVSVVVYTEEDGAVLTGYVPELIYDENSCSLTLFMSHSAQ